MAAMGGSQFTQGNVSPPSHVSRILPVKSLDY